MSDYDPIKVPIIVSADANDLRMLNEQLGSKPGGFQDNLKQGSKHIEVFGMGHRQLGYAMGGLARQVPGLHMLMRGLWMPQIAAIGLVVEAVVLLKKHFADLDKAMEETLANNAKTVGNLRETQASGLADAIKSHESFIASLRKISEAQKTVTERSNDMLEALHKQASAQAEMESREKALELEQVHSAESLPPGANGRMTRVQALKARAAIEDKYAKKAELDKAGEEGAVIMTKQDALAKSKKALAPGGPLEAAVAAAEKAQLAGVGPLSDRKANADAIKTELDKINIKLETQIHQYELAKKDPEQAELVGVWSLEAQKKTIEDLQKQQEGLVANWRKAQVQASTAPAEIEALNRAVVEARERMTKAAEEVKRLEEEIPKLRSQFTKDVDARHIGGQLEGRTRSMATSAGVAEAGKAEYIEAVNTVKEGKRLTAEDLKNLNADFRSYFEAIGSMLRELSTQAKNASKSQ